MTEYIRNAGLFFCLFVLLSCNKTYEEITWTESIDAGQYAWADFVRDEYKNLTTLPKIKEDRVLSHVDDRCLEHLQEKSEKDETASIIVQFLLDKNGKLAEIYIEKGVRYCSQDIIQGFEETEFTPGVLDGSAIPVVVRHSARLRIQNGRINPIWN